MAWPPRVGNRLPDALRFGLTGRHVDADSNIFTGNELLTSLHKGSTFRLAMRG